MTLRDDLNAIGDKLEKDLIGLSDEFAALEAEQQKALEAKATDLRQREDGLRAKADADTEAVIEAADKLIADAQAKDQAEQQEKLDAVGKTPPGQTKKSESVSIQPAIHRR